MLVSAFLRHLAFCAGLAGVSAMVVAAMISAGVMDTPNGRKAHVRPTPKGGGIGVVVAFLVPWLLTLGILAWVGRRIYIWRRK